MSLEALVMPLWRFKAGDYEFTENSLLDDAPRVINLDQSQEKEIPWYIRLLSRIGLIEVSNSQRLDFEVVRGEARAKVEDLVGELNIKVGKRIEWVDEGDVRYCCQYHHPEALRAFVAWLDLSKPIREFEEHYDGKCYDHPVWKSEFPPSRKYPTIVGHSLFNGYLLPFEFEGVFEVEAYKVHDHWEFTRSVASSNVILREIDEFIEHFLSNIINEVSSDLKEDLLFYSTELKVMCERSLEHGLPVIFHG